MSGISVYQTLLGSIACFANPKVLTADSHAPLTTLTARTHTERPPQQFVCVCQITIIKHYRSQIQLTSLTWVAVVIGRGREMRRGWRREIIGFHQVGNCNRVKASNTPIRVNTHGYVHRKSDTICLGIVHILL